MKERTRDVSLLIWCNKTRAQSLDKRRVLTSQNACTNKFFLLHMHIYINAHKKIKSSSETNSSSALIRFLLIHLLISFFFFIDKLCLYFLQLSVYMFIHIHTHTSTVQFSTTSTPNKCRFFCMCALDGHMRRYNKPTLPLEINGFEWQNVSFSFLSIFFYTKVK